MCSNLGKSAVTTTLRGGSTDMGNVSHVVPSIHPAIGSDCGDTIMHNPEFARSGVTTQAYRAVLDGGRPGHGLDSHRTGHRSFAAGRSAATAGGMRACWRGANEVLGLDACADGVVPGIRADLVLQRFDRDYACLPVRDRRSARLPAAFLVDVLSQ
ncbi:hypothetical protein [Streptomyces fulvoviolaceus]|uniref:hypothetical protein n=1 Tax=Streptomyces fulvoviolaceus TaxID=285535 RepID=UPI00131B6D3D|nr:hypothetical protein [Streptomyces fulvoviolaceus]